MLGNRSTCSISVMPRRTNKDIQFYDFVMRGFSFPQASPTAIVWISLFTSHLFFGIFIWTLWILRKYSMIITGRIFASLQTMQCINLKTSQLFNVQLLSHVMSPLRNVLCLHFSLRIFLINPERLQCFRFTSSVLVLSYKNTNDTIVLYGSLYAEWTDADLNWCLATRDVPARNSIHLNSTNL